MIQQYKTNASSPKLLIGSHRHTSYQHHLLYLTLLMNTLPTTTTTTTTYIYLPTHQPTNQPTNLSLPLSYSSPIRSSVPPFLPPSPRHPHYLHSLFLSKPTTRSSYHIRSNQIKSKKNPHPPTRLQQKKRKKEKLESEVGCLHAHAHAHTRAHTRARPRRRQVL